MTKEQMREGSVVEVDEHEKELQALFLRVMASPLTAVMERLAKIDDRLAEIEESFGALRSAQADQAEEIHRLMKQELKKLEGRFLAVDKAVASLTVPIGELKQGQGESMNRLLQDAAMTRSHLSDQLDARSAELASGLRVHDERMSELAAAPVKQAERLNLVVVEKHQALMELLARQVDGTTAGQEAVRVHVVHAMQRLQKRITWVGVLACVTLIVAVAAFVQIV